MGRKNSSGRDRMSHITNNPAWLEEECDRNKGSLGLHSFKMRAHGRSGRDLGEWCTFSMTQFPPI